VGRRSPDWALAILISEIVASTEANTRQHRG
jgi:hypothetical protein